MHQVLGLQALPAEAEQSSEAVLSPSTVSVYKCGGGGTTAVLIVAE